MARSSIAALVTCRDGGVASREPARPRPGGGARGLQGREGRGLEARRLGAGGGCSYLRARSAP